MKNILPGLFILFQISCYAQTAAWNTQHLISGITYVNDVSIAEDGSVFVTGSFDGSGEDSISRGGFVSRYSSSGDLLWSKQFYSTEDPVFTMSETDHEGNLYVSGHFDENIYCDEFSFTGRGLFFLKYDLAGTLVFSLSEQNAYPRQMKVDASGNVYLAGTFRNDLDSLFSGHPIQTGGFIAKYNHEGTVSWAKDFYFPITPGLPFDFEITADESIYATGPFGSTTYFSDSASLTTTGAMDIYLAKYDPEANLSWVKAIATGGNSEKSIALKLHPSGEIYISGFLTVGVVPATSFFDTIPVFFDAPDNAEIFVACYDSYGSCKWVRTSGGDGNDMPFQLALNDSALFITGGICSYGDSASFGDQTFYSEGYKRFFLASYDFEGNLLYTDAGSGGQQYGEAIAADNNGGIYAAGNFYGSWNFGPLSFSGGYSMFLLKMQFGNVTGIHSSADTENHFDIYPNPSFGLFTLISESPKSSSVEISVLDIHGKIIRKEQQNWQPGRNSATLDLSGVAKGIYSVRLITNDEVVTKKVVVN